MAARKTSLTLTDAAYEIATRAQLDGEPLSATVSRLLQELETVNQVLDRLADVRIVVDAVRRMAEIDSVK